MGEWAGRTVFATVSTLALVLSSIGAAGMTLAADACDGSGSAAPAPPHDSYDGFPAAAIHVGWANTDDALLQYVVTDSPDPLKDPFGGTNAAWTSGCRGDAIICEGAAPLVLAGVQVGGRNQAAPSAGRYTIVAAPGGACAYYAGDDGKPYYASAPGEIAVTATIESYPAGKKGPSLSRALEPVMVPTLQEVPMDLRPYRRALGTFDWDPATGVSNVRATGAGPQESAAELPPLPWWMANLIAAAPVGYDALGGLSEGMGEEQDGGSARGNGSDAASDAGDGSSAADEADFEESMLRPVEGQPPPADPPPEGELKPGRRWVSVGAQHVLAKQGTKKRRGLRPGVWYQVREMQDGSLVFYDTKGKKLGTTPKSHRGVLQLQEEDSKAQGS